MGDRVIVTMEEFRAAAAAECPSDWVIDAGTFCYPYREDEMAWALRAILPDGNRIGIRSGAGADRTAELAASMARAMMRRLTEPTVT